MSLGSAVQSAAGPGDEQAIFADRLQAQGDPRGELLALELASLRAPTSARARALNREAQCLREAHAELMWPAELLAADKGGGVELSLRAGLLVSLSLARGQPSERAAQLCACPQARWLDAALNVAPRALKRAPARLHLAEDLDLASLESVAGLAGLRELAVPPGLVREREAEATLVDALAGLPTLERLVLPVHRRGTLPALVQLPALASLVLAQCAREDLELLAGFAALRSLELATLGPVTPDAERALLLALAGLESLDALSVHAGGSAPNWRDLLPTLKLRSLTLLQQQSFGDVWGWRRVHAALAELPSLEALAAHGRFVSAELFAGLPALRGLELWGLGSSGRWRAPRIELPRLEQLRVPTVWLQRLRVPALSRLRVDGELGPQLWGELARAGVGASLRELELHALPSASAEALGQCGELECLYLEQQPDADGLQFIAALPSLRRLRIRGLRLSAQRQLSEALPALLVEGSRAWPHARS